MKLATSYYSLATIRGCNMKRTIIIVDDMEINREILAESFRDKYDIVEAENGKEALTQIESGAYDVAAVLLDMVMPEMDGMEVLRRMNESGSIVHIPVFIITAENNESQLMEAYNLGAVDVIVKPFMMTFLRCRIENIIELYSHRNDLEEMVNEQVKKFSRFNKNMVEALATLVEFRDCESGEHIKRMCGITEILMNKVSSMFPEYRMPKAEIDKIVSASVLHDVGKIAISDVILNKPGRLTPEEFEIMKQHTVKGGEILQRMPRLLDDNVYNYSYDIARHHHERWDGNGYPDHLMGDKISIWAQVVSVADVYDALVSPRIYKSAFEHETAVRMIMNGDCGVFNPKVLKAFEMSLEKIHEKHLELTAKDRAHSTLARLLIVDDSEIDRTVLKNILEPDFQTIEAVNGYEALKILEDETQPRIDGILLDIAMPVIDGFTVLKILRGNGQKIPVVLMTADATKENVQRGIEFNISAFLGKPFNPHTVIQKLHALYKLPDEEPEEDDGEYERPTAIEAIPEDDIESSMTYVAQLKNFYTNYLANTSYTDESYRRVSALMHIVLEEYVTQSRRSDLDADRITLISKAAYFYDIGVIGIPDEVVAHHETLDDGLVVYEDHARMGAYLVRLNKDRACKFFVDVCADICMHHHERYDGTGYPHKLEGNDMLYYTALTALCIDFDNLFFKRDEYNDRQFSFIIKELQVDSGKFDPDYIKILKSCENEIINYYRSLKNTL